jgi:hypothetical protein
MTPEHDLIFYPNSPIMEQEVKDDYENFSELDIVKQERAHYQRLYSAEYSKIEAIKDVVNYGRSIESQNGTANIILNKLESIINENK